MLLEWNNLDAISLDLSKALNDKNIPLQDKLTFFSAILGDYEFSKKMSDPIKANVKRFLSSNEPMTKFEILNMISLNSSSSRFNDFLSMLAEDNPSFKRKILKYLDSIAKIPTHNKRNAEAAIQLTKKLRCSRALGEP